MPNLNTSILSALPVNLPPLPEQRRIARVLGALDDLIDTNERLATSCEELARAFTRTANTTVLLGELGTRLPPRLVAPRGSVSHYSLPAFDDQRMPALVEGVEIKSSKIPIEGPAVLVSRLNPHISRVWMVYPDASSQAVASTEFVPIVEGAAPVEELYAVSSDGQFLAQMAAHVTGTTGSHQRVDKSTLFELVVPNTAELSSETRKAIRLLIQDASESRAESARLRRTRDELLPLLMSGKVRVAPTETGGIDELDSRLAGEGAA